MDKEVTFNIPASLFDMLQKELAQSPFANMDELMTFIVQQYFDQQSRTSAPEEKNADEAIRKRLEGLGYL